MTNPKRTETIAQVMGALAVMLLLAGCGSAPQKPTKKQGTSVIVIDNPKAKPRLTFGSLTLLMTRDAVTQLSAQAGWTRAGEVLAEGSVTLRPPSTDVASEYRVRLEGGRVIQIAIAFRQPDESREEMRHDYARAKIQANGSWAMTDPLRTTLIVLAKSGTKLVATHLGQTRDKAGGRAMLERYLGE